MKVSHANIFLLFLAALVILFTSACDSPTVPPTPSAVEDKVYGVEHLGGQFLLGPVDWEETVFVNSFGPYPESIQLIEGNFLALVGPDYKELCDACIKIVTDKGKSIIARVVSSGSVSHTNDIDLSPQAFAALDSGELPRTMKWYVTKAHENGAAIRYQFNEAASVTWSSLWVRNISLPLTKVEVKSANHADWTALARNKDGAYVDASGFGAGSFSIRLTAIDGQVIEDSFLSFKAECILDSKGQFK